MAKYWIAVASHEHVKKGVEGGFAQVCHGKGGPLKRMKPGDWIIYYSPVEFFGGKEPCREFTALGQIKNNEPYQFAMSEDFVPYRRDVHFMASREIEIAWLLNDLTFIKNKKHWGMVFRYGLIEIPEHDFMLIAEHMGVKIEG